MASMPGIRVPQLDQVLDKIRDSQQKQMKVIKANLTKKDRNSVTLAVRTFKEKKASEVAKEMLEDKIYKIKDKNDRQIAKVAERKIVIEALK
jgi:hypothetical protein